MKLKLKRLSKKINRPELRWVLLAAVLLSGLFFYQLGSLAGGISKTELDVANTPLGWHGIYSDPMFAVLDLTRSAVFYLQPDFGQALLRLSNVLFGILACVAFYFVVRSWHGAKIALLTSLMFVTSAFTLHVTRIATNDVMYFIALPLLFFGHLLLRKSPTSKTAILFNVALWLNLIFTPGLVWFVLLSMYVKRECLKISLKSLSVMWKSCLGLFIAASLGLLAYLLYLHGGVLRWLGLPTSFEAPLVMLKEFAGVFVHLFVRGPQYPEIWLGRSPILDAFALAMCAIGIYFYAKHRSASRTKTMMLYAAVGIVLVALGGPVSIALLVPLLFLLLATGITYIRQEWLQVFPNNPIARNFGVGIIIFAVGLSCFYNLRAYFVAWPHNKATQSSFSYQIDRS